jgi:hypothetical protein
MAGLMTDLPEADSLSAGPPGRTYSAVTLVVVVCASIGLPLAGLMLVSFASRPVGILPGDVFVALGFGSTMSTVLGAHQYFRARSVAGDHGFLLTPLQVPHASQVWRTTLDVSLNEATEMAANALKQLNPTRPLTVEPGKVATLTPIRFSTWGERLEIVLEQQQGQRTLLRISSQRRFGSKYFDAGKGVENIARLSGYLRDMEVERKDAGV